LQLLGVAAVTVLAFTTAGCGGSDGRSTVEQDVQQQADLYEISRLQTTFHEALAKKDIEMMMRIWAPNATVTVGPGQTMTGLTSIREHWLRSTPFKPENRWISESPSYKTRATANGNKGTLFFECHLVDTKTAKAVVISGADMQVAKLDGRWLVTSFVGSTVTLSP
jgi:hypothetical protein